MPIISVIMPTYNSEAYLAEAVQSVIGQTFKDWELIVVDDSSTDYTFKLMQHFCEKDKRIKYILNEENRGISYTRNRGIKESTGKYIAVMDSDDIMSPSRLKKSLKYLEKGFDCIYTSYLQADENGKVGGFVEPETPDKLNVDEILRTQMVPHVTMVGKKELFRYNDEYRTNDDLYLVLKMFIDGANFKKIKEPLMIVRYHSKSTSATKDMEVKKVTEAIKNEFKDYIK